MCKRIYLKSKIHDLLIDSIKSKIERLALQCKKNDSNEPIEMKEMVIIMIETWFEDQFVYDVNNFKNRMLGCYAKEFYTISNETKFVCISDLIQRYNNIFDELISRINVSQTIYGEFYELLIEFTNFLNSLWNDIGLSDYIMSLVTTQQQLHESKHYIHTPNAAVRHFFPLIKLSIDTSIEKTHGTHSNKKRKTKKTNSSKVKKSKLSFDSFNTDCINSLKNELDKTLTNTNQKSSFSYIENMAIIILEVI